MSSTSFSQSLRRLWARDKFSYSVRVFIALTGSMAFCWYQDEMSLLIPLFLGIIASALAETDDSWQGRLNALPCHRRKQKASLEQQKFRGGFFVYGAGAGG